jgi:hypothetical protein
MNPQPQFTFLRLMHIVAMLVLIISGGYALAGYMHPVMSYTVSTVLSLLLKVLVETAAHSWRARSFLGASGAALGAVFIASLTVALTAATLYAKVFAGPSASMDFTAHRTPLEREAQRLLAQAAAAQTAMTTWATDAAAKAKQEEQQGGSCPNRADTGGKRGPVTHFRESDGKIAAALAAELKVLSDSAQSSTSALVALPKPKAFVDVQAGFTAMNKAADDISRLAGSASQSMAMVKVLEERRVASIEASGGAVISCGDMARLTHIQRAADALTGLAGASTMARVQPGVDVSDPQEVLTRSMLRSMNAVLSLASFGYAGSFGDDRLMLQELKRNGWLNSQTLALVLSTLAEVSVVFTALLLVFHGRAPFSDTLVGWLRGADKRNPHPSAMHAVALAMSRRLANLFYVESAGGGHATQVLDAAQASTGFGDIELVDDPTCRPKYAAFAEALLPYHYPWADKDYVVIPVAPQLRQVRSMAHALRAQGQFHCISASAPAKSLESKPDIVAQMQTQFGDAWRRMQYEVFEVVKPAFAQLMRLQGIDSLNPLSAAAASSAMPGRGASRRYWSASGDLADYGSSTAGGSLNLRRHIPLRHKLALRPRFSS